MTTMTETGYAEAVRQALDDLPRSTVAELLEGLDEHLAEIGAPNHVSLVAMLGAPERYAADLRASAGLPPRVAPKPSTALPPPPPPVARGLGVNIRARHVARAVLAAVVAVLVVSLFAMGDSIETVKLFVITIAIGAGALVLGWLARAADLRRSWAAVGFAALAVLTIVVAAVAGADHARDRGYNVPYPVGPATTVMGISGMPDLTGVRAMDALNEIRGMGLVPSVTGNLDESSVVVSQDPPAGRSVSTGTVVHIVTERAGVPSTFATIPTH